MLVIRRAKQEDKKSMWNVQVNSIKEICKSHYTQNELRAWLGLLKPGRYKETIESKAVFVAIDGDAIVGFGQLDQENGHIEDLYVRPDHAKRGVGMKILLALEDVAKKSGSLLLHGNSTLNAIRFYEKAGYRVTRQKKYLLPNDMVACIHIVKKLSA
jgi:ribosomal protein S18 acetylase RimI-like enzyme